MHENYHRNQVDHTGCYVKITRYKNLRIGDFVVGRIPINVKWPSAYLNVARITGFWYSHLDSQVHFSYELRTKGSGGTVQNVYYNEWRYKQYEDFIACMPFNMQVKWQAELTKMTKLCAV